MIRRYKIGHHVPVLVMLVVLSLVLFGCGSKEKDNEINESSSRQEVKEDKVEKPVEEDTDKTESIEKPEGLSDADRARKAAYVEVLKGLLNDGTLSDYEDPFEDEDGFETSEGSWFCVRDVNGDGESELIVSIDDGVMADMVETVYGYSEETGKVFEELTEFPGSTYYANGIVKSDDSHNQGDSGDFWPYSLYKYNEKKQVYEQICHITAVDSNYTGKPFLPESTMAAADFDRDGIVYFIEKGDYYSDFYNEYPDEDTESEPIDLRELNEYLEGIFGKEPGIVEVAPWGITERNVTAYSNSDKMNTPSDLEAMDVPEPEEEPSENAPAGNTAAADKEILDKYYDLVSEAVNIDGDGTETFAIADLNSDGIPELIIDDDGLIVSENLYYTYKDGIVQSINADSIDMPSWGEFYVSPKLGTFVFHRGGPAMEDDNGDVIMPYMYLEYKLEGNNIEQTAYYHSLNNEDKGTWECYKDNKAMDETEFNKITGSFSKKVEFLENTPENRRSVFGR